MRYRTLRDREFVKDGDFICRGKVMVMARDSVGKTVRDCRELHRLRIVVRRPLKTAESLATVRSKRPVQHVKPKIPGFKECADWVMGCSNWVASREWVDGARRMHDYIARNFGR